METKVHHVNTILLNQTLSTTHQNNPGSAQILLPLQQHQNFTFTVARQHIYSKTRQYLLPDKQRDGRNSVGVLVAFGDHHLLEELDFLLTGQEHDLRLAEDHYSVCELVSKQPRLWEQTTTHASRVES